MTMVEIGKVIGLPVHVVRRHRRLGRFNMDRPESWIRYVVGRVLAKEAGK